ncbi:flavin reductase [Nesterenkonia sphaerica]|nr:flavin reductase [Nesterenkonia sphaerica]
MASVDQPLIVVTTVAEGELAGCVVGFHTQSGISPQRYCLWLSKANHTYRVGLRATHFAVHFLSADNRAIAERFGTRSGDDTDMSSPGFGGGRVIWRPGGRGRVLTSRWMPRAGWPGTPAE